LLALQSGLIEEEEYALHHLVKISHERGDKYRFDGFPGLAEALIHKVLEVTSLFYNISWDVAYYEEESVASLNMLNGLTGTPDLLDRLKKLDLIANDDEVEPEEFTKHIGRVSEAGLVLRNMVMLQENAQYVSRIPLIRDVITVVLNLPRRSSVIELKHYALEIAEQLTSHWVLEPTDHVYQSLLSMVETSDRGFIITALRALSRISMNLETKNRLANVPVHILRNIADWLLVEDEDLRNACLDFLYQFTAVTENVGQLVESIDIEPLINQLVRLLLYNATITESRDRSKETQRKKPLVEETVPKLSSIILDQLVSMDEPERSSQWSVFTCVGPHMICSY
jgi:chromatin structure-remodeling complex subunit RSC9